MLHDTVTSCYTIQVGEIPRQRGGPMEIIGILTAAINLVTAIILWQTAKRNRRKQD